MPLTTEVRRLYTNIVQGSALRYTTTPAAAAGVAMVSDNAAAAWAWAAYVQVVAAATITDPSWIAGILAHTGVVETHNGEIAIASGAGAAEVDLAMFSYVAGIPTAVGVSIALTTFLPMPIYATGQPRLAGRIRKSTAASLAGVSLKINLITGMTV